MKRAKQPGRRLSEPERRSFLATLIAVDAMPDPRQVSALARMCRRLFAALDTVERERVAAVAVARRHWSLAEKYARENEKLHDKRLARNYDRELAALKAKQGEPR